MPTQWRGIQNWGDTRGWRTSPPVLAPQRTGRRRFRMPLLRKVRQGRPLTAGRPLCRVPGVMDDPHHNDCLGLNDVKHRVREVSGDCSPNLPMNLWIHFRSRTDPRHPFPDAGLEARFELRRDLPVDVASMPDLGSRARPDHNPARHPSPNNSRSTSAHGTLLSGFSRCASRSRSSSSRSC